MCLDATTLELKIIDSDRNAKPSKQARGPSTIISTINETNSNATSTSGGAPDNDELPLDPSKCTNDNKSVSADRTEDINSDPPKPLSLPLNTIDAVDKDTSKATTMAKGPDALLTMCCDDVLGNNNTTTAASNFFNVSPEVAVHGTNRTDSLPVAPPGNITTDRTAFNPGKSSNLNRFATNTMIAKERSEYHIRGPLGSLTTPDAANKPKTDSIEPNYPPSTISTTGHVNNSLLSTSIDLGQQQSIPGQIISVHQEMRSETSSFGADAPPLLNMIAISNSPPQLVNTALSVSPPAPHTKHDLNLTKSVKCETELLLSPAKLGQ